MRHESALLSPWVFTEQTPGSAEGAQQSANTQTWSTQPYPGRFEHLRSRLSTQSATPEGTAILPIPPAGSQAPTLCRIGFVALDPFSTVRQKRRTDFWHLTRGPYNASPRIRVTEEPRAHLPEVKFSFFSGEFRTQGQPQFLWGIRHPPAW